MGEISFISSKHSSEGIHYFNPSQFLALGILQSRLVLIHFSIKPVIFSWWKTWIPSKEQRNQRRWLARNSMRKWRWKTKWDTLFSHWHFKWKKIKLNVCSMSTMQRFKFRSLLPSTQMQSFMHGTFKTDKSDSDDVSFPVLQTSVGFKKNSKDPCAFIMKQSVNVIWGFLLLS